MNRTHLAGNFVDNPEALFRRTRAKLKKRSSTLQQEASSNQEYHRNLSSEFEAMANKSIREFSAPTTDNIRTGHAAEIDGNFELKPGLINMVQSNQFCGKAHEDASAHLQHFLEICSTITISGVPRDAILLRLFLFSLLGRAKQWFYATKEKNTTWALCSTNFLAKFFPMGKTNALRGKITTFQQQHDESVPEAWERFQDYMEWRASYRCRRFIMGLAIVPERPWMLQLEKHSYHSPYHKPQLLWRRWRPTKAGMKKGPRHAREVEVCISSRR